jgi:hypothetical protein
MPKMGFYQLSQNSLIDLFIYDPFKDAVSSYDHIARNVKISTYPLTEEKVLSNMSKRRKDLIF